MTRSTFYAPTFGLSTLISKSDMGIRSYDIDVALDKDRRARALSSSLVDVTTQCRARANDAHRRSSSVLLAAATPRARFRIVKPRDERRGHPRKAREHLRTLRTHERGSPRSFYADIEAQHLAVRRIVNGCAKVRESGY